jgi:hypothetical protein
MRSTRDDERRVRAWLRLEGLAAFVARLAIFGPPAGRGSSSSLSARPGHLGGRVPGGRRVGTFTYNLAHTWAPGIVVLGWVPGSARRAVVVAGAILVAHVGMDRAVGLRPEAPELVPRHPPRRMGRQTREPARARTSPTEIVAAAEPCSSPAASTPSDAGGRGAVGVRAPSLYKRFPSRGALIAAIGTAALDELHDELVPFVEERDPAVALAAAARAYRAFAHASPRTYELCS